MTTIPDSVIEAMAKAAKDRGIPLEATDLIEAA